jgi:beta-lactamase superfamily II metal-dependent hydrolase
MRKTMVFLVAVALLLPITFVPTNSQAQASKTLEIYFIDTEGGQATLFVSPSGESLLFDTGTADPKKLQADRISSAIKDAGVQQLDHVIISHYHGDHVGNATELATRLPIRNWYDHGAYTVEHQPGRINGFMNWLPTRATAKVTVPKPGDRVPIAGLDVVFVSGSGNLLASPIAGAPGAGLANPFCKDFVPKVMDPTPENYETLGAVIRYGNFRLLDLADLSWNQEKELACPNNLLGTFDVYHTTRHGTDWAGAPALIHATRARVVVMNNGATKGPMLNTWNIIHGIPGFQDLWQLHYAEIVEKDHNPPEQFIANLDATPDHPGYFIKMSVRSDGSFAVKNQRTGFTKEYPVQRITSNR